MSKDDQYPFGYELSFMERTRLRLRKVNYRLSVAIAISVFGSGLVMLMIEKLVPGIEFQPWRDFWVACIFLLFGFEGMLWAITGEIKHFANITERSRWVTKFGFALWIVCWCLVGKIVLSAVGVIP